MNTEGTGQTFNGSGDENATSLARSRSFRLAMSAYSGEAILATSAQFASAMVVRVTEVACNYEVVVELIRGGSSLDRVIAEFLKELTMQQVRLDVERRFGITRDRLVDAAFESRDNG